MMDVFRMQNGQDVKASIGSADDPRRRDEWFAVSGTGLAPRMGCAATRLMMGRSRCNR
jgi:hypothetical protein